MPQNATSAHGDVTPCHVFYSAGQSWQNRRELAGKSPLFSSPGFSAKVSDFVGFFREPNTLMSLVRIQREKCQILPDLSEGAARWRYLAQTQLRKRRICSEVSQGNVMPTIDTGYDFATVKRAMGRIGKRKR